MVESGLDKAVVAALSAHELDFENLTAEMGGAPAPFPQQFKGKSK